LHTSRRSTNQPTNQPCPPPPGASNAYGDDGPVLDGAAALRLQGVIAEEMLKEAAAEPLKPRSSYYAACPLFDRMMNASWGCPYFT
jgi:CubicO group peptidase (beta-lactamase class C family)